MTTYDLFRAASWLAILALALGLAYMAFWGMVRV